MEDRIDIKNIKGPPSPERKAKFILWRRQQILDSKKETMRKVKEIIASGDLTKAELSSRNGKLYREILIDHFGQEAYDNELKRRKKIRDEISKEKKKQKRKRAKKINIPSKELSQNAWNIRKARIAEIGHITYLKEQQEEKKDYNKKYTEEHKEERKKYNEENKDLIKLWAKTYREKHGEEIRKKNRLKYELDENFRNKVKQASYKNLKKNIERKRELGLFNKYTQEEKEKIMNGTFFTEKAKETRIKRLTNKKKKEDFTVEDFLKKKSYEETIELLLKAELIFKNSFIIDLKANSIFYLDSKCFYAIYLKNENIFDLLIKDENGYTFGIVGKNIFEGSKEKRTVVKQISFQNWEQVENFAKALQSGF